MSWLRWLDEHGAPPSAGRLAVFDAGTHGWMEWAEHGPGEVAAEDYFQRFGAMLCLAHLFNANDLHYENVVVAGSIPHIVDLETLFHPRNGLRSEEDRFDEVERAARGSLRDTVAWTKLLPAWLTTYDVDAFAIGALNPKEVSSRKEYRFVETNTDLMQVVRVDIEAAESKSLPQSLSGTQWASHGAPLLCEGFERMWQFVANHRRAILKRRGPLEAFRNAHVRVLLKSTQLYFFALKRSLAADFLVDGGVWSSQQQVLCRFLGSPEMALRWFDVFRAEERALARLDVPYFSVRCDGTTLLADGEPLLKDAFAISPFRSVRQHLLQMSTEEMKRQTFLISQSVLALEEPILVQTPSEELTAECATRQDLIAEAQTIGNLLLRSSVEGKGHHWISLAPLVRSRYRQIEAMGIDLYSGNSGIALFFAALGSATKDESWGKAARAALVPVLASIRDRITASKLARAVGLGAATGLGSIAYSLARIGRFLQSEEFCEASLQICKHVTSDLIQFDQDLDALSGTAGGILGLLTVASETAQDWPIEIAIACGDHLLAFAQSGPDGTAFWRGRSGEIEAGMAHGAAGICLALHRLGEVAGSSKYTSTALSGLEFERRSDARGDYFSTLPVGLDRAMKEALACRWCRGSAGLGLALVGTVGGAQLEQRSQIRALTEKIRAHTLAAEDNLCCGNFGRVEFLLAAGLQLHDEDLILQARLVASRLLRRRRLSGSFAARVHDEVNPGFFTGISGIGYGLLRSIEPDSFPSVLLWE
jgi:type 2 lantibiotic biosynthesis protein LanM